MASLETISTMMVK